MRRGSRRWFSVESLDLPDRLLLSAVVLLPWAFGGVEIWAYRLAALFIVVAATLRLGSEQVRDWDVRRVRILVIPALAFLALALFQLLPMPASALAVVSPKAHEIHASTFPGFADGEAGDPVAALEQRALSQVPEARSVPFPREAQISFNDRLGGRWHGWRPISLVPVYTIERIFWFVPLLITFLMFHSGCRQTERRQVFQAVLFLDFLALALFGLVFAATGSDKLYWVRTTLQGSRPLGPYVNPNNFAAVMELATPWVLAAAWSARRLQRRPTLPFPILLATGLCCLAAGLVSGSRAAIPLIAGTLAVLTIVALPGKRARLALGSAYAGFAGLASVWIAFGNSARLRGFFELGVGGLAEVERVSAWRSAWSMLQDFPWSGVGIGAFRDVFPIYAPAGGDARLRHLHNDYFEVIVETGWIGALLLGFVTLAFLRLALRRSKGSLGAVGLVLGLASLMLHALVDFNHQIPANALLFVAVAGMAVAREEPR